MNYIWKVRCNHTHYHVEASTIFVASRRAENVRKRIAGDYISKLEILSITRIGPLEKAK